VSSSVHSATQRLAAFYREGDITGSFPWNAGKRLLLASSDIDGKVRSVPVHARRSEGPQILNQPFVTGAANGG